MKPQEIFVGDEKFTLVTQADGLVTVSFNGAILDATAEELITLGHAMTLYGEAVRVERGAMK